MIVIEHSFSKTTYISIIIRIKNETIYEVKRYLKILFLRALRVSVSLIFFGMLLKTFAPR